MVEVYCAYLIDRINSLSQENKNLSVTCSRLTTAFFLNNGKNVHSLDLTRGYGRLSTTRHCPSTNFTRYAHRAPIKLVRTVLNCPCGINNFVTLYH